MLLLRFSFFFALAFIGAFVMCTGIASLAISYLNIVFLPVSILIFFGGTYLMVYALDSATAP